jgi:phospholipid/cholesterol/gamma-HCH transport system substrate-binding protein
LNGEEQEMIMKREVRVGIFLSGVFLILAVLILVVGDVQEIFRKSGYRVYAVFDSALGLEKNAAVKLAGINIGKVKEITLDGRRARVTMSIYPGYQIPHGSRATLASLGILGEKYVEIVPGRESTYYQPEETMDSLPPISFDQLGALFMSVAEDIKKVAASINNALQKDLGPSLRKTLENLESLSGELDSLIKENRASLHQVLEDSGKTFNTVNRKVETVSNSLQDTLVEIKTLVQENREGVKDNLQNLERALNGLDETIQKIKSILDRIEKGEGTAGKLLNDAELYQEATEVVGEIKKITSSVTALSFQAGASGLYYEESQKLKGGFYGGLLWNNRALISAGLTHQPWQDRFVYSFQAGWRWQHLVLRGGLIESKFGAGVDWYLLKNRLLLSLEGFDFNRQVRPQFRLAGRFYPMSNLYLVLGLEDFTLTSGREIFFGLGVEIR